MRPTIRGLQEEIKVLNAARTILQGLLTHAESRRLAMGQVVQRQRYRVEYIWKNADEMRKAAERIAGNLRDIGGSISTTPITRLAIEAVAARTSKAIAELRNALQASAN